MKLSQFKKFTILHLLLVALVVALILASVVEQQKVTGQSKTRSPDGNWSLELKLIEHWTLFSSRQTLKADLVHATNSDWTMLTSVPISDADAKMIGDEDPNHPVSWSDDSSMVTYWISKQLEDAIKVQASSEKFVFDRKLGPFSYSRSPPKKAPAKEDSADLPSADE